MSIESNKEVLRTFSEEFINTANPELAEALIHPDAAFDAMGTALRGPAGYLQLISMLRSGFPDIQWTLEEMVAEGDKIAARFTMRGTHRGEFLGIVPTGRSIVAKSMAFYRLVDGQIIEEIGLPDMASILRQIGAAPGPTQ